MNFKALQDVYSHRRVLVTGHTGFKGAWLSELMLRLGVELSGLSLPPLAVSLFNKLGLKDRMNDIHGDVRDLKVLKRVFHDTSPEIVFHLAGQSLVHEGVKDPLGTYSTNIMGTANLLEVAFSEGVKAVVVVSSDKCYQTSPLPRKVGDNLGGLEAYSVSKAAMELICEPLFARSGVHVASARAGNAVGGGDWGEKRLVPDIVRAIVEDKLMSLRSPNSVRPWQHVLELLWGYLMLGSDLLKGKNQGAWNFGPSVSVPVSSVIEIFGNSWKCPRLEIKKVEFHENPCLLLDSERTKAEIGWFNRLDWRTSFLWTIEEYKAYLNGSDEFIELLDSRIADYSDFWS